MKSGAAPGEVSLPVVDWIDARKSIGGSAAGSLREIEEMSRISAKHGIMPVIELHAMTDVNRGLERSRASRGNDRTVLVHRN